MYRLIKASALFCGFIAACIGTVVAQSLPLSEFVFSDIDPSAFYAQSIHRLARYGIVTGYTDGTYRPNDPVRRGELAVILDRFEQRFIQPLSKVPAFKPAAGVCGNRIVETHEECDDGNTISGDGCSHVCLKEPQCVGGYNIGERFLSTDGCNICTCGNWGIVCTKDVCSPQKCFSQGDCTTAEVCSLDIGICRFPCPDGAQCQKPCAGSCMARNLVPRKYASQLERLSQAPTPPEPVSPPPALPEISFEVLPEQNPLEPEVEEPQEEPKATSICGNGECERGESDVYSLDGSLEAAGTCPADCAPETEELSRCEQSRQYIDTLFDERRFCETNDDCAIFARGCSPYQTCGKAIERRSLRLIKALTDEYASQCPEEDFCGNCVPKKAVCRDNRCELN